jgi:hypothetical protein
MILLDVPQDGGLDPAEAEIRGLVRNLGLGKRDGFGISKPGKTIKDGTPGISQAKEFGHLIIGLAGSIISRSSNQLIPESNPAAVAFHSKKTRMAA